tara:strand:+ start:231 stop:410 length:180 start_codon:yes stop_codon:yes gene_type:complete
MSNEENHVFSGSIGSQTQMVNVQPAGTMMYVEKSQIPQVLGICGIILLMPLFFSNHVME